MRLGWTVTTDYFSSRAPDQHSTGAASRGPFYFAWGCFRDFVSGPCGVPPIARRRIDSTPTHRILGTTDRRYLQVERQYRHRHRQLPDAFTVDVGADHAIAVDGDPRCVAPRDLRVREITAVA